MLKKSRLLVLLLPILLLSSCSGIKAENKLITYLNYYYQLKTAGDLHGIEPTSNEVLNRNTGFTDYTDLFDKYNSYINFQCDGTNYSDFHCDTTFNFKTKDDTSVTPISLHFEFLSEYVNSQSGTITILNNDEAKSTLGTIYVYTPYWTRWQYYVDLDGSGEKTLITFEFWKYKYNDLPEFINS